MTKHLIADARLRDDETWVACTCGATIDGTDAETINEPYQAHRIEAWQQRGETCVRHDGIHGTSWRKGGNAIINTGNTAASRRYYERNRAAVLERQRTRYWAKKAVQA